MNYSSYKKLTKYCDKLLLSKSSSIYTHSISDLHIIKEHPELLKNYFQTKKNYHKKKNVYFKKILKYLLNLFFEKKNYNLSELQKKGCDVLILSNIINEKHLNIKDDFYFGDIENKLNNSGFKTFTILRNFTKLTNSELNLKLKKNKILLFKSTYFLLELILFLKAMREFFLIKKKYTFPNIKNLKNNFLSLLSFRTIITNLRFCHQVRNIVQITKPSLLIITFEGHAWERVLIKMIKMINSKTKIAAYQFTSLTKNQYSVFRKLNEGYNPDLILTTGSIPQKKFTKKYSCKVKIIGSVKYKKTKKKITINKKNTFLILPEAFYSETLLLYNFSIACAKIYPDFNFIFKCHPMLNNIVDKTKLKNFKISKNSLSEEILKSRFVIYRGTAGVYESVFQGLIPIYLKDKNEMSINPIYDVFPRELEVSKPSQILKIVKKKKKYRNKKLLKYCKNYFYPLNNKPIINYLKNILKTNIN